MGNFHKDYLFTETMCLMILFCVLPPWYRAYVFNVKTPSSIETICLLKRVFSSLLSQLFCMVNPLCQFHRIRGRRKGCGLWFQKRGFGDLDDLCKRSKRHSYEFQETEVFTNLRASSCVFPAQVAGKYSLRVLFASITQSNIIDSGTLFSIFASIPNLRYTDIMIMRWRFPWKQYT